MIENLAFHARQAFELLFGKMLYVFVEHGKK